MLLILKLALKDKWKLFPEGSGSPIISEIPLDWLTVRSQPS